MRAESLSYDVQLQGAMADIMARTSTKNPLMSSNMEAHNAFMPSTTAGQMMMHNYHHPPSSSHHKRSVSDGNSIFQSMMSNRAQQQIQVPTFETTHLNNNMSGGGPG